MTSRSLLFITATCIAVAALTWLLRDEAETPGASPDSGTVETERPPEPRSERRAESERRESPILESDPAEKDVPEARPNAASPSATSRQARVKNERLPMRIREPLGSRFSDRRLAHLGNIPVPINPGALADEIEYIRTLWIRAKEEEEAQFERSTDSWVPREVRAAAIKKTLRSDLGDEYYDAMLYATDQPNRARIGNVIGTSPAAAAGLRIKDLVLRYNGERVFEANDLKRLSASSDPERVVVVWIRRNGEEMEMYVPGGPLGIRYFPLWEEPTRE